MLEIDCCQRALANGGHAGARWHKFFMNVFFHQHVLLTSGFFGLVSALSLLGAFLVRISTAFIAGFVPNYVRAYVACFLGYFAQCVPFWLCAKFPEYATPTLTTLSFPVGLVICAVVFRFLIKSPHGAEVTSKQAAMITFLAVGIIVGAGFLFGLSAHGLSVLWGNIQLFIRNQG